jgi:hypothetical protein
MAELDWEKSAAIAYGQIAEGGSPRLGRVDEVLDELETDPSQAELRRRAFTDQQGRAVWAIPIQTYNDDLLLLWQEHPTHPDTVFIAYLGPNMIGVCD